MFNNLTVATPTHTMAYKYAAFDGFNRLATGGGISNPLDLNRNEGSGPYDRPYMTRQIQNANFRLMSAGL